MHEEGDERSLHDIGVEWVDYGTAGVEDRHLELAEQGEAARAERFVRCRYKLTEVAHA